jgi:hypothetical protein
MWPCTNGREQLRQLAVMRRILQFLAPADTTRKFNRPRSQIGKKGGRRMKPEELRTLLEKIVNNATIRGQEITAAQWKHIDHEYSQIYYEEQSKAGAKEYFAARATPPHW